MSSITPTRLDPRTGKPARDSRWRARYRDPSGKSRSRTFDRKVDAERFLNTTGADIERGEWIDPRLGRSSFDRWAQEWWATTVHLRPTTRHGYKSALHARVLPYFQGRPIASIERVDVRRFIAELVEKGYAPKTVRQSMLVLSLIMQTAQDSRAIRDNPATRHRLPRAVAKDPIFLTAPQVNALAEAIRPPYGTLVLVGAYTGLRPGELCGLKVGRVDMLRGSLEVAETLTTVAGKLVAGPTKTYAKRTVPLPPFLVEELAAYLSNRSDRLGRPLQADDYLFVAPQGGPLRRDLLHDRIFKKAVTAAQLPAGLRVHDLRHTCAALLIAGGAHPKAIQERLGHSTITVTMDVYGHLLPSVDEKLTDTLEDAYQAASTTRWEPVDATVIAFG